MMVLSELQQHVFDAASAVYDGAICMDLFKPGARLGEDYKIKEMGMLPAVQAVIDDSIYWGGSWFGTD